jgi:class 3 adenylate cyclase
MQRNRLHLFLILFSILLVVASRGHASARGELRALLNQRRTANSDHAREQIAQKIRKRFGRFLAVMVTDMEGMTAYTRLHGVESMLGLIDYVQQVAEPLIERRGAVLIKTIGDDMLIVHPSVKALLELAHDIKRAVRPVRLSIGIAYGFVIYLDGEDVYGNAVNVASKLGEDIAKPNQILLGSSAIDVLNEPLHEDHDEDFSMDCGYSGSSKSNGSLGFVCSLISDSDD